MKNAHYDKESQKLLGWYDKDIHKAIPTPHIEVSDEVWQKAISENANYVDVDTKTLLVKDFRTAKEIIEQQSIDINNTIQAYLDTKAKEFRYDNMMSARSYAGYTNPFQAEAQNLAVWASNCWVKAGEIEVAVKAGDRDMPTIDEVLAELPVFE